MKVDVARKTFAESMVWNSCFGNWNPHLSVSVSCPPDVATIKVLAEGDDDCCHWSISRSVSATLQLFVNIMNGRLAAEARVKYRVSGHK